MRALVAPLAVVLILLAGCAGGSAKAPPSVAPPSSTVEASDSPFAGTGSIRGLVIDESAAPIEGASVQLSSKAIAGSLAATTGPGGDFVFSSIAAGAYVIYIAKLGYASAAKNVDVTDGAEATATFSLVTIALEEARHYVVGPYTGFIVCAFTKPGVSETGQSIPYVTGSITYDCGDIGGGTFGEYGNTLEFKFEQENYQAVAGEMRWSPTAVGTSAAFQLLFTHSEGSSSHWWCGGRGTSPVSFVWNLDENMSACASHGGEDDDPVPTTDMDLELWAFLPFDRINSQNPTASSPPNIVFQQDYESMVTVFYGKHPPEGYSAFGDA